MIRGACPSLFAPMQSGDGWLVRVRPRRSMLSAAAARRVADAAARHGNGVIGLTNRGNLQIRGLSPGSAAAFAGELAEAGLAGAPNGPDLLVSPLAGDDPAVHPQTDAIAGALEAADIGGLPDKFLIAIDGGGAGGIGAVDGDITLRAHGRGWAAWIGGEPLGAACDPVDTVPRLVRAFREHADGARRMRDLVRSGGSRQLFHLAGLVAEIPYDPMRDDPMRAQDPIGFLRYRSDRGGFGLGIAYGQLRGAELDRLAALAERFGDGIVRFHPSRCVLIAGVAPDRAEALRQAADGFIADPADPRRRVVACPGAPGCASATVATQAAAALLAGAIAGGAERGTLHVSGCAKGCAHPGKARITLVGEHGRYGIVRNGRAADPPEHSGLTLTEAARMLAGT